LAITAPLNTAITAMLQAYKSLPSNATGPQVEQVSQPAIAAIAAAQSQLLAVSWPTAANSDIRTLVTDMGTVHADLLSWSAVTSMTASNLGTKLTQDIDTTSTQAKVVRADLGLPTS
jgi:hypothetical protein